MPQASKQLIEKKHGRALLDFLGIKCTLESGKPPDPDLLFRHEGRRFGVEDTRLFAEDGSARRTPQARKKLVDEIAGGTQLEYEKRGLPPVEVLLYMRRCNIRTAHIKALADQIVDVVTTNLPDNPGRTIVDNDIGDGRLPVWFDSITITRYPELAQALFSAPRSEWIPTINAADLQQTIDGKAERLHGYHNKCDEVWLLMVEEGNDPSDTLEMPDKLWKHSYDFRGFARVFVLRGRNARIIELVGYSQDNL
jgi:hypothetical protein